MTLSFETLWRRTVFGAAILGLGSAVIYFASISWLASSYGVATDPQQIRRAIAHEPHNAQLHHRMGRLLHGDLLGGSLREAIVHYQRATELDPRSAQYWLDLASAYEQTGEPAKARQAFEKAKVSYPVSSQVAWNYGNFLLRQGESSPGFSEIRRALAVDARLARPAVSVAWRTTSDVERILEELLPPESRFYLAALQYFLSRREIDPALTVWDRLLDLEGPLELQSSFPLFEALLQRRRVGPAQQVWKQALQAAGWVGSEPPEHSRVWNGSFEQDLVNGGFGWRKRRVAGASFDFDPTTYRSGSRSLRVRFDGSANVNFQHLVQYVPVEPRSRYRFAAFLRSEDLSTDSGLRFQLFDPKRRAALDILTPGVVGSDPWVLQEAEFTTGPETRLLAIALRRLPSRKFDNKLRGTVWVDDVSLTPAAGSVRGRTR